MAPRFKKYLSRAKSAEDKDDQEFRRNLLKAISTAQQVERNPLAFILRWRKLANFYLSVFDVDAAERVLVRARRWRLLTSRQRLEQFQVLLTELKTIPTAVEAAKRDLLSLLGGADRQYDPKHLVVFVPSAAVSGNARSNVYSGIRRVVAQISESLLRNNIPHVFVCRLRNHGTPRVPSDVNYISHHTKSTKDNGLHLKATDRPNCFSLDGHGYSGWASISTIDRHALAEIDDVASERKFREDQKRYIGGQVSKYAQSQKNDECVPEIPWIFVALQTVDDAVQQLAYVPMLDMLREVAGEGKRRGIPVVVKRHPRCNNELIGRALDDGMKRRDFLVSRGSIHPLIAGSCAVCTVNSSVGAEALLHLKPVYVFGAAEYQYACYKVRELDDFGRIFLPDVLPIPEEDIKKFLYYLRMEYAHDVNSPTFAEYVDRKIRLLVGS